MNIEMRIKVLGTILMSSKYRLKKVFPRKLNLERA
jgi:hypothetical protein